MLRNTEKEIESLKLEIRERNDLVNILQVQNDLLREEMTLYDTTRVRTENLLDL